MKEILEKVGLGEFFAYVCPGAIVLCSFFLWERPDAIQAFFQKTENAIVKDLLSKQIFLIGIFILIFAYTLGLIVASVSSSGAQYHLRIKAARAAYKIRPPYPINKIPNRFLNRFVLGMLRGLMWVVQILFGIVFRIPDKQSSHAALKIVLKIRHDIERFSGLRFDFFNNPWDELDLYRTLMTDQVGERARSVLTEADSIHRRFLFSRGVAFAFFLLATQAFFICLGSLDGVTLEQLYAWLSAPLWQIIGGVFIGVSFGLRSVAGLWLHAEFLLTASIAQLREM